jgi:thymidylate synthase
MATDTEFDEMKAQKDALLLASSYEAVKQGEIEYLKIIATILRYGVTKENRTGIDTLVIRPTFWEHDMRTGVPLFTTKAMAKLTIARELKGFISGITSKKWYQDRKVKIWDGWCNPDLIKSLNACDDIHDCWEIAASLCHVHDIDHDAFCHRVNTAYPDDMPVKEKLVKSMSFFIDDLGPIYGFQWRNFGSAYASGHPITVAQRPYETKEKCLEFGDQLSHMILTLKSNPNDRRMKVEAWNFNAQPQQALPACHTGFTVTHINGVLNLSFDMRSVDMFLGAPFNMASYGMLLLLICKETGMEPGFLSARLNDCHVYKNHIEQCKTQLSNPPHKLCTVEFKKWTNIWDWEPEDLTFIGYESHDKIPAPVAI